MEQILDEDLREKAPEEYEIASTGKRVGNLLLDYVSLFIALFIYGMFKAISSENSMEPDDTQSILFQLVVPVFYIFLLFAQEALMNGRTLGKWITGTRVLHESGEPATVKTLFIRNLCRLIPFDALSFFGKKGWHDSLSHTVVVNSRPKS